MLYNQGSYHNGLKIKKAGGVEIVEKLSLSNFSDQKGLESTIEQFPNLRTLNISNMSHRTNEQILSILSKCKQLDTLIIGSTYKPYREQDEDEDISDYMLNVQFHEGFINTIANPQLKIEFMENGRIYGVVTKDEIVWRKKLLHWIGYEPALSQSKLELLDLASIPKESQAKHKQPLNLIFNYLDLNGLYAFCMANKQCKQLVHNYIYQRCKQHSKHRPNQRSLHRSKFVLSDEFAMNYNTLRVFGKSINYLDIHFSDYRSSRLERDVVKYCKNLTVLCFRTMRRVDPQNFIFPQIRHYIFYGYGLSSEYKFFCDLTTLSRKCPNLEKLEIKTPIGFHTCRYKKVHTFQNLKKIIFKPHDEKEVKYAEEFFKNSTTEIIVDRAKWINFYDE